MLFASLTFIVNSNLFGTIANAAPTVEAKSPIVAAESSIDSVDQNKKAEDSPLFKGGIAPTGPVQHGHAKAER